MIKKVTEIDFYQRALERLMVLADERNIRYTLMEPVGKDKYLVLYHIHDVITTVERSTTIMDLWWLD